MNRRSTSGARRRRSGNEAAGCLCPRLRETREGGGLSLREIGRRTGVNSGYLSQLERGLVSKPSPGVLQKLADAYAIPLHGLMCWAGYLGEGDGLSPNQARALSYLGDDPSSEEVEAIKAVLKVLRKIQGSPSRRPRAGSLKRVRRTAARNHKSALHRPGFGRAHERSRAAARPSVSDMRVDSFRQLGVARISYSSRSGSG